MPARDMAERIGACENREPERQRNTGIADADIRARHAASTALPQPPKTSQNVPDELGSEFFRKLSMMLSPFLGVPLEIGRPVATFPAASACDDALGIGPMRQA